MLSNEKRKTYLIILAGVILYLLSIFIGMNVMYHMNTTNFKELDINDSFPGERLFIRLSDNTGNKFYFKLNTEYINDIYLHLIFLDEDNNSIYSVSLNKLSDIKQINVPSRAYGIYVYVVNISTYSTNNEISLKIFYSTMNRRYLVYFDILLIVTSLSSILLFSIGLFRYFKIKSSNIQIYL